MFIWLHRKPTLSIAPLQDGLRTLGYAAFQPPRDDLMPGTVILLDPVGQELILSGPKLGLPEPEIGRSTDYTWHVAISGDGKAQGDVPGIVGNLSGLDAAEALVTLKDVTVRKIALSTLAEALRSHPKSLSAASVKNPAVVIVSEVLVAGSMECEFRTSAKAQINLSQKLKDAGWEVASGFKVSTDGKLVCDHPMPLGFKSHPIGTVGRDFSPTDFVPTVAATELTPNQIAAARSAGATDQLSSEYQLFCLCLGLGNYRLGALPGAGPSAEHVADELRRCVPASQLTRVEVHSTRPAEGSNSSPSPMSREGILRQVDEFVARNKSKADPARQTMAIFYFCGHGLAQGISRTAYLVPEDVPVAEDAAVDNLAGRLVDVAEIDARLAPLAEHRILLIDGCRKHDKEDEQLLQAAPRVGLDSRQLGDIVKVLQFASGKDGPQPMLFGGPDGENAQPVDTAWASAAGPLAERVSRLLDQVRDQNLSLAPRDFVVQLQTPVTIAEGIDVQAYTSLRDDFLEALPRPVLFGTGHHDLAVRDKPYVFDASPSDGQASSPPAPPPGSSGVKMKRVGRVHIPHIADFTYSTSNGVIYAADDNGSVWSWRLGDSERKAVKGDVPFASLISAGPNAYLYSGSTRELYRLSPDSAAKISDGYAEFLARGAGGKSIIIVENDHTVGTPDAIRRLPPEPVPANLTQCPATTQFDTTDVQGLIELTSGVLLYTSSTFDGSLILRSADEMDHVLAHGLGRPSAIAQSGGFVYVMDFGGLLYRRDPKGAIDRVSLADIGFGDGDSARHPTDHGLEAFKPDLLWIAADDGIFELDLTHAHWQPFAAP